MRKILSSILTLLILGVLFISSANSFAQQVPFANVPFDINNIPEPVPPPAAVRDFFQLDPYYQQWINIRGFPVLASAEVRPYTVKEVAWTIGHMVRHRPDILRAMAEKKARFSIVPHNKHLLEIPEYDFGRLDFFWELRARGLGGLITSSPEENIICGDRNYCYAEVVHEFAHQVHMLGLSRVDPTFDRRLKTLYNMAKEEGLYQNRYASSNRFEYWAEGVGSWFNGPHPGNVAHTRSALKKYDPRLARLLTEVHGDGGWRYTPPATRTHLPHLQWFNPEEAPIYQRPARLLELEAQLRDPNSEGDGKWVNLELHPPSQLRNLIASTTRGDGTDFIFLNLTGTDLSLYFFHVDGKKSLYQHSPTDDALHIHTWVGAIWLIQDHTGKDLAVFRAEEEVGRVLIGGPPSRSVLDVNSDGIVDLLDLIPIASRYGHRGVNPADINKDRMVNIVDVLLVAGSVAALPRQVVETFNAAEVQKWLSDANQLGIESEYKKKGVVVLEHLLAEMVFLSTSREAAGQSETIFPGHTDIVWSVAFSSDGQTLASSGWDDKIRLWNAETKQHKITLIERSDIMTVAFSPDGQTLASGNWDAAVRLWNPSTGEIKRTLIGHTEGIESVVFSPDGGTLASGSADRTIRLWDPSTGKLKRTLIGQARMRSVAFSPDGRTLASGSSDHTIRLWNPDTGKLKRTLPGHTDWVEGLVFSPDGNTLASGGGSEDRTLRLWNLHNGREKKKFTGYTGAVSGIAFSPDGRLLASGGWGTKIRLWNTETSKDENALEGHTRGVFSVAFSPDGQQLLVSGGEDGTVRLWEVPIPIDIRTGKRPSDINEDGKVDKIDLLLVVAVLGAVSPTNPRVDVDGDGRVAIADLLLVVENLDDPVVGAAPEITTLPISVDVQALEAHLNSLRILSDGSHKYQYAIAMLEDLLASMRPAETQLLANYPNPFNPETWIPYQLSEAADVRLNIYSATGTLIRTFELGHQPAGIYQNRSRAAYWDGKNELGEKVASGVYFYTLSAGDFTATRKMLIRK